jgi:hypothetical protein
MSRHFQHGALKRLQAENVAELNTLFPPSWIEFFKDTYE